MATGWETAALARNDFADMIETLSDEQLKEETLCAEWTPKHILAHLVNFSTLSLPKLFFNLLKSGFNFDESNKKMAAASVHTSSVDELLSTLREKATATAPMPTFPEGLTVTDIAVHTQDVRRPLNLPGELDKKVLESSFLFLTGDKKAQQVFEIPKIHELSFTATDLGITAGEGQEITGTAEAIILALMRRPVLDELTGSGVSELAERLQG